jgi:hypothetical protein
MGLAHHDRVFLDDFLRFAWKQHLAVARILVDARRQTASYVPRLPHWDAPVPDLDLRTSQVESQGEERRFESMIVAKLFAEMVSTLEDFGAFCAAIRDRRDAGILVRFLRGRREVYSFYAEVLECPTSPLDIVLKLPSIETLANHLDDESLTMVQSTYTDHLERIAAFASIFSTPKEQVAASLDVPLVPPRESWGKFVHVITDVSSSAIRKEPFSGGVTQMIHNKIKHRYMVIDQFDELDAIKDSELTIEGQVLKRDTETETMHLDIIETACFVQARIAALVLALDTLSLLDT